MSKRGTVDGRWQAGTDASGESVRLAGHGSWAAMQAVIKATPHTYRSGRPYGPVGVSEYAINS